MEEKTIRVLAFGIVAEKAGVSLITAEGITDITSLQQWLHQQFPLLKEINYSIAADRKIVTGNADLKECTEIALLPPFSGG